jgi:uncharacterized protein (DUF2147 family)
MRFVAVAVLTVSVLAGFEEARPEEADAIVGVWVTEEGEARIEITPENGQYIGHIVWLEEPNYPADDKEAGKPRHDRENPDPAKRKRPIPGIRLFEGFTFDGKDKWTGGEIYDAESGKTYKSKITMKGPDELHLRGFVGISLLGRTSVWTRHDPPADAK